VREDHAADLVRELEAPRAEEGYEERRVDQRRVVVPRVHQPEDLDPRGQDEWHQEEERPCGGLSGGKHGAADVAVAGDMYVSEVTKVMVSLTCFEY
jgi:hypothetical protein